MDQFPARDRANTVPRFIVMLALSIVIAGAAVSNATENGASVYPVGVETVMPGMAPPPHGTTLYEYTAAISANQVYNGNGDAVPTEFKLRVFAVAIRVAHNWGLSVLGGTLESYVVVPFIDEQLHITPGKFGKFAVGNVALSPLGVRYVKGRWHYFYEGDIYFPGTGRSATDVLNIGQNNYAAAPAGGFTLLKGREELSSKLQYIFNLEDSATNYQGGNEFVWEFDGTHEITRKIAVGANGFLYKQTTDDKLNNVLYQNGNRGQDFAIGPEIRFDMIPHGGFAFKYLRDTMVENRAPTNSLWFQLAVPITVGSRE